MTFKFLKPNGFFKIFEMIHPNATLIFFTFTSEMTLFKIE